MTRDVCPMRQTILSLVVPETIENSIDHYLDENIV